MKVTMDRDALGHVLDLVVGLVPSRSTLPILSNILVEAVPEKGVRLTATDLDVSIAMAGAGEVKDGGAVAVPGKLFADTVHSMPGGVLQIATRENEVEISSPGWRFRLLGMDAAEFPRIPASDGAATLEIPGEALPELISRTSYAISRDDTRPALNGVLWELGPKELRMVATDGHRLARYRVPGSFAITEERQVIVPPKSLMQLQRLIREEPSAKIRVELGENHVRWRIGDSVLFSKLIEGPFPKYEQVIPKDNDKRLVVNRELLMERLKALANVSDRLTHMVRFSLKGGEVKLSTRTPDVGEAEIFFAEALYEGAPLDVGYNASYVLDALQHMTAEQVEVLVKTQTGPGVFKEVNASGPGEYLCLVMPLRLPE